MKKIIICIMCITILILSIPVTASADEVVDIASAGILSAVTYAQAVGYDVASSVANYGYDIASAGNALYSSAVGSAEFGAKLTEIVNLYPEAAASAASAAGVSSLTAANASQLSAAVGSLSTVSAGSVVLPIAAAAIVGAVVYYALANSVDIPDYGLHYYTTRWGLRFGSGNLAYSRYYGYTWAAEEPSIYGATKIYPGCSYETDTGHTINCILDESLSSYHYWYVIVDNDPNKVLGSGVHVADNQYNWYPQSIDLDSYAYLYLSRYNTPMVLYYNEWLGDPGSFRQENVWGCQGDPSSESNWTSYLGTSTGSEVTVRNTWVAPDVANPLPGYDGYEGDDAEVTLTPSVAGVPGWSSSAPDVALAEYSDAVNTSYVEDGVDTYTPDVTFAAAPDDVWDPDADWTENGNPNPTDGNNPDSSPTMPTGGILVPWHYVVRMLEDASVGLQTYYTLITAMIPTFVLNIFYALLVLFILFGVLHRFLK